MYLFTDEKGKFIEMKYCPEYAEEALKHRSKLEKNLKIKVIAWSHMGGDNPGVTIK